jgi:DNA adenine methylase
VSALKPPFSYFGGKTRIAEKIAALLPAHEHYVEPFAGSLAVLLAKPSSRQETVNDLSGGLVNFWQVLRDRPADLERACALTPHSRAEYEDAWEDAGDDLERARRVWVQLTQGRGGRLVREGWRHHERALGVHVPGDMAGHVRRFAPAASRLAGVSLECRPALEVIAAYGRHREVLIYADPPYLGDARTADKDRYASEMRGARSHRALAGALAACDASVVLSGYASPLYEELYQGWHRREILAYTHNGSQGSRKTDVVWSNRPFSQATLFDLEAS